MEVTLYVTDMVENRLTIINGYNLTLLLSLLVYRKGLKKGIRFDHSKMYKWTKEMM